jgi:hypothetical protein
MESSPTDHPPRRFRSCGPLRASVRTLLARLLAPVLLLIVLPLSVMKFLENYLSVALEPSDRSLIHFFLFLFFLAYLAILSPPVRRGNILHARRSEFEAGPSLPPKTKDLTTPNPPDAPPAQSSGATDG